MQHPKPGAPHTAYYVPPTGKDTPPRPAAAAQAAPQPARRARRRTRPAEIAFAALALALVLLAGTGLFVAVSVVNGVNGLFTVRRSNNTPPQNSFAVLYVVGTIQSASGGAFGAGEPSYKHGATVDYIKQLAENEDNKGILLYMNTGGGGIYESDEVYRALENYKEKTGRPVWGYMAATCASGGYYICMAAEKLIANYNTTTGSIGVYIQLTDTSGLYEKIGVRTVLVKTGDNKAVGADGTPITDGQRAVYQSMVDESFARFTGLVQAGRGLPEAEVEKLADGRPFTANQALEHGLVDELGDWESAKTAFEEHTGARAHTPNFSQQAPVGGLLGELENTLPQGESETLLTFAENLPDGVPLAWAPGLEWD